MQTCHSNGLGTPFHIGFFEAYLADQWTQNGQMSGEFQLNQMHAICEQESKLPMPNVGALQHPYKLAGLATMMEDKVAPKVDAASSKREHILQGLQMSR